MKTIEIYKTKKETIWNDSKTYLIVFDKNGKQVADYDFYTGLKMIQSNKEITIFIDEKNLVSGKWKFFGTKVKINKLNIIEESVFSEGFKDGSIKKYISLDKNPWSNNNNKIEYSLLDEREKRIKVCRSCPFFVNLNGSCLINNINVIESTKIKKSYCPENKWGSKENSIIIIEDQKQADIIFKKDQEDFENDLEKYLNKEGL